MSQYETLHTTWTALFHIVHNPLFPIIWMLPKIFYQQLIHEASCCSVLLAEHHPKTLLLINASDKHFHNQSTDLNFRHSPQLQSPHTQTGTHTHTSEPITYIDHYRWCDLQLIRCYLPWTKDQCLINEKKNTRLSPSRWTDIIFLPISLLLTLRRLPGTTNQSQMCSWRGRDKSRGGK